MKPVVLFGDHSRIKLSVHVQFDHKPSGLFTAAYSSRSQHTSVQTLGILPFHFPPLSLPHFTQLVSLGVKFYPDTFRGKLPPNFGNFFQVILARSIAASRRSSATAEKQRVSCTCLAYQGWLTYRAMHITPHNPRRCIISRSYCYTVWSAIGISVTSVRLSVCLSVTLCIVALMVDVRG